MSEDALERLALAHRLQLSYRDLQENVIVAKRETLLAALRAMGVIESEEEVVEALSRHTRKSWEWYVEPVIIAWEGRRVTFHVRAPEDALSKTARLRIEQEDGAVSERDLALDRLSIRARETVDGQAFVELRVVVPGTLPLGYHRVSIECGGQNLRSMIIAAPRKAYAPDDGPGWGVFLPLYALHSSRSWGIGDYSDLKRLTQWAGGKGASFVATLPLLPTFLDEPFSPSPYEPVSRLFWNEVYIDPEAPIAGEPAQIDSDLASRARALLASTDVDYAEVMRLKREALEAESRALEDESAAALEMASYLEARPEVREYAAFRAAMEKLGPDWRLWPERQRLGNLRQGEDFEPAVARYFEYAQWRASMQVHEVADVARDLGMRSYLDLPVGVHQQGFDAWRHREVFAQGVTVGAPPDLYAVNGQNWGFQPLNPGALRRSGYDYVVQYLRHYFNSAKMLRIDHAIGLHRLYWIPDGATGRDGVFVTQPSEELYAVLCLESMRYQAVVVAEDLGLVPPEVGSGLRAHGISGMYVQMFEMTGRKQRPLRRPRPRTVASFSTHDLPPFAAYWQDADLGQREMLGLLTAERIAEEKQRRDADRRALVANLKARGLIGDESDVGQVFRGSTALLSESEAEWVQLNLEDGWGELRSQNLPGTTSGEHPNWVNRAALSLEEFDGDAGLFKAIETVRLYRPIDNKVTASSSDSNEGHTARPTRAATTQPSGSQEGV